ncbi:Cadmium, zinc and cobalt-transporting ATPase [bioreactor metagenome]|jgi:Cd2+/Zn2+-exporting ATPase|uniref:Cadmium-translocating P-type ATPase n=4 Tax=root TaxID=1 RepID=A0A8J8AZX3_9FIRM|nr:MULTISPECIES: heavy metal translocating P-type ATPase [Eubacteriales]MDD3069226.1 heavy metal translocating P-type ATPase [Bacilli bacterium]MEA5084122.1 heavy metal translocating P-type ATPase [Lachnospiraceae bacterium]ADY54400.1 heavy metal translocating P-type ATPase [Syntrophobotulus glycolicus DSM 8271]MBR0596272.1 cadmium-translocating P-type ATPase [Sinanaerobacter chloroacetimidivorans]QEY35004.1 cadmium-translocating P-type ATPase [Caproiciproducens galactitolivorans]
MNKKLVRIIIAAVIFVIGLLVKTDIVWLSPAIFIAAYIVVGSEVVIKAIKNIMQGQVFQESFLMTVATGGALIIGEYPEAIAVMLFYQVGEYFQSYAVAKSRKSIASLMDIRPDYANVKRGDELVKVDPDEVAIGDIIVVRAGEKIPLDGKVLDGNSMIDTSALTGESVPREAGVGSDVLSGCINVNGVLTIEVTKEFGESTVSKILDLVENASSKKANTENFITKFARVYTPIVMAAALLLAIIPPLFFGGTWGDWIYRALTFLVVSCPCALVVSIPLSFFGGIGGASRRGVLVKGSNYLEALAQTEIVVFDKTGTLTKGVFKVQEVNAIGISEAELLELTAHVESYSNHPISLSLKTAYGKDIDNERITDVEEIAGHGVSATVDSRKVFAGNTKLMQKIGVKFSQDEIIGTAVHVAVDGKYAGYIVIADEVKEDAAEAIRLLKKANIRQTVMLTGDAKSVGEKVAKELGLDKVYTELLPGDKVDKVEELLAQKSAKGKLAFVGDGINDAPVLARADIGIAMGGLGSDAAIEAADVVIMTDEPSKLATGMKISQKTLRIAQQNIWLALSIKAIVLVLSALGFATMWEAVFADVGVTVIAVLNSFRALNTKKL